MRVAEQLIPEGRTTLFSQWCLADADFGFMLQRLRHHGHPMPKKVGAYAQAQWERPSAQRYIVRPRPAYVPY